MSFFSCYNETFWRNCPLFGNNTFLSFQPLLGVFKLFFFKLLMSMYFLHAYCPCAGWWEQRENIQIYHFNAYLTVTPDDENYFPDESNQLCTHVTFRWTMPLHKYDDIVKNAKNEVDVFAYKTRFDYFPKERHFQLKNIFNFLEFVQLLSLCNNDKLQK